MSYLFLFYKVWIMVPNTLYNISRSFVMTNSMLPYLSALSRLITLCITVNANSLPQSKKFSINFDGLVAL
jgi:hypothetical protein